MSEQTYTVLVVDDEEITRTTLSALLASKPVYRVELAVDGVEGLEMAKQIKPDVILLDIMMPRMSGYDVCKKIRSDPNIGEVPIIMITALDDRDAKLNGLVAGADDFLTKPFDSFELDIRLHTLRRVNRYRHLVEEREKLQAALAELSAKHEQLRVLSRKILEAQENERRRVAIELHDEVGQMLTGLKLILSRKQEEQFRVVDDARAVADELLQRVREMSLNLRPATLDDLGLYAALDGLFKRFTHQTQIAVKHNINPLNDRRFDNLIETTIFRVTQEALTNVARHAGVNEVEAVLNANTEHIWLGVEDKGKGFDITAQKSGSSIGLSGMAERVNLAGGNLKIQSSPGKGTFILVDFMLNKKKEE
jgi:signal transduction histidine kinase